MLYYSGLYAHPIHLVLHTFAGGLEPRELVVGVVSKVLAARRGKPVTAPNLARAADWCALPVA